MSQVTSSESDLIPPTWQAIERLADEAAELAGSRLEPNDFYQRLLGRCISALGAQQAVSWQLRQGRWSIESHVTANAAASDIWQAQSVSTALLEEVARSSQSQVVLPSATAKGIATNRMVVLCPVILDDGPAGVIGVFGKPTSNGELQQAWINLLAAMAEAASDFHRNNELRQLRQTQELWEPSQEFMRRVHGATNVQGTYYAVVNDGRRLLKCDRLSLGIASGRRCRIVAVSGVERIQRRSSTIRYLEQLSQMVIATGEPLHFGPAANPLAPEVEQVVHFYLDETHVRYLSISPLRDPDSSESNHGYNRPTGVLIVEQFEQPPDTNCVKLLGTVCQQSQIAIRNAKRNRNLLARIFDSFRQSSLGWKILAACLLLGSLVTAAVVIPAELRIQARGRLLPEIRQDIFAPQDGEVRQLLVDHNDVVQKQQILAQLSSAELDLESRRLNGERLTIQERLAAARAERGHRPSQSIEDRRDAARWSAIEKELQQQLDSVQRQLEVVQQETDRLAIQSPITGRVQTWDVRRLLEARPVSQGQVLMTIADVDGPWIVELDIPDHHMRHIQRAQENSTEDLQVSFVLKTAPDVHYDGKLRELGTTTVIEPNGEPHVKAIVEIDRDQIRLLRSGAGVVGRIHCGQSCLGYVWLHDLIDAVKTWLFF